MRTPTLLLLLPALALAAPARAAAPCADSSGLCVNDGAGVRWKADASLTGAALRKENKKRKGAAASLDLAVDGGRGTVFIDGRFAGVAPLDNYYLEPGAHDLQVRDGNRVLAEGVLTVPAGTDVSITVNH